LEEVNEQIRKEKEIQYNDENEIIDSVFDLLTNFFCRRYLIIFKNRFSKHNHPNGRL